MDGVPAPCEREEPPPERYVAPRTGLFQTRVGLTFLMLFAGALTSFGAAFVTPISPFGIRDLRIPVYGAWLAAAVVAVAVPAARKGRWWLAPWFAVGMIPFGGLMWIFDGWRC